MFKAKVILFIHVLFVFFSHTALAYTLSGVVIDKRTGDVLIGATVVVKERPSVGTAARSRWYLSVERPSPEHENDPCGPVFGI